MLSSSASPLSFAEIIRKQQEEAKELIAKIFASASLPITIAESSLPAPPGMDTETREKKKNRNQSHKKKLTGIFDAAGHGEGCGCEAVAPPRIAMADAGIQTDLHLPHAQKEIVWTASSLSPIVGFDEEGDGSDDEAAGAKWRGVNDIRCAGGSGHNGQGSSKLWI